MATTNRETALRKLMETARTVKLLKKVMRNRRWDVARTDIKLTLTGSVILNSGIDSLAEKYGLTVKPEPFAFKTDAGETLECVVKVIRMGGVEIIQAEDAPDAEE